MNIQIFGTKKSFDTKKAERAQSAGKHRKILFCYPYAKQYEEEIRRICEDPALPAPVEFTVLDIPLDTYEARTWGDLFAEHLDGVTAVIGDPKPEWLAGAKDLEWLQISWAGARPYVEAPELREIADTRPFLFTNSAGAYGYAVADHLVSMFLALTTNLQQYAALQRENTWKRLGPTWSPEGRTALILGSGDLGSHVAERLRGFSMKTIGLCRTSESCERKREAVSENGIRIWDALITPAELDVVLPTVDLIVGCLPSNQGTQGLLSEKRLRSLKDTAILVNAGRGDVLDTDVLTELVLASKLWGVGLDVTNPEPLPADHPLWQSDRAIITPHCGGIAFGFSALTEEMVKNLALKNLRRYVRGEEPKHQVSFSEGY